jgi:hypothetical protein
MAVSFAATRRCPAATGGAAAVSAWYFPSVSARSRAVSGSFLTLGRRRTALGHSRQVQRGDQAADLAINGGALHLAALTGLPWRVSGSARRYCLYSMIRTRVTSANGSRPRTRLRCWQRARLVP